MKVLSSVLLAVLCAPGASGFAVISATMSDVATSTPANYECKFTNLWSASRHPIAYPSDAHWSPPVVVAHSDAYQMWAPGTLATPGIELVAEVIRSNLARLVDTGGSRTHTSGFTGSFTSDGSSDDACRGAHGGRWGGRIRRGSSDLQL